MPLMAPSDPGFRKAATRYAAPAARRASYLSSEPITIINSSTALSGIFHFRTTRLPHKQPHGVHDVSPLDRRYPVIAGWSKTRRLIRSTKPPQVGGGFFDLLHLVTVVINISL